MNHPTNDHANHTTRRSTDGRSNHSANRPHDRRAWVAAPIALTACLLGMPSALAQRERLPGTTPDAPAPCRILFPAGDTSGVVASNTWPDGLVPYGFNDNVTPEHQLQAITAMGEIEAVADVDFFPQTDEANYIMFQDSDQNSSFVGMVGGAQPINIQAWDQTFVIVHELMHALAVWHEQQRNDRDDYVEINWDKIQPGFANNFTIPGGAIDVGVYDFDSVMHYGRMFFSVDFDWTIDVLEPYKRVWQRGLSQDDHLSNGDIWVLYTLYGGTPPPRAFELTAPADGARVGNAWMPTFDWTDAELADAYHLVVDDDGGFASPDIDVTVTQPSYVHDAMLPPNRVYHWTVTATNANGQTQPYPFRTGCLYTADAVPAVLHVDDDAARGGGGADWTSPLRNLQDALVVARAVAGDVTAIHVAQGVYRPDYGTGDRKQSFVLVSGVAVLGGYAGINAPDPDARDPDVYVSVLTGDLAGNDLPGFVNIDDNSFSVVYAPAVDDAAVLDGFTITAGNAATCCVGYGAGAGIQNDEGSPVIRNCIVTTCSAAGSGGGIANMFHGGATIDGCSFTDNRAQNGGGCVNWQVDFTTNIFNSVFARNTASAAGGALFNLASAASITNCVFAANTALPDFVGAGGAVFNTQTGTPRIHNSTFYANTATIGGAVYSTDEFFGGHSTPQVTNCILWNDTPPEVAEAAEAVTTVRHTDIQGGWSGAGSDNIDLDPLFQDADGPDGAPGTADDDLRLLPGSPAIDAGVNTAIQIPTDLDLDGHPRFIDDPDTQDTGGGDCPIVDMGPFEFQQGSPDCAIAIVAGDPPDNAIDARQPSQPDGTDPTGWDTIVLTFDGDAAALTPDDIAITQNPPGDPPPPDIADLTIDGDTVTIQLTAPINPERWTAFTHMPSGTTTRIGYLPADVNNDRLSNAGDILALIDDLNGVLDPPLQPYQTDTDRSGTAAASDILRVIDLLNGAGAFDIWLGATLPE